jgi:glyoxylase-like metal-dependent hydrolase (beta-lactamase superfamily II)
MPSYDTRASQGLQLVELAPGVQHQVGGSHHSMIVEMKDHLIVFDSPISDWQSNWVLNAAKQKYPGKPVKFLVLTHLHMDRRHLRAQGAAIVVGRGPVLAAPFITPTTPREGPEQDRDHRGGGQAFSTARRRWSSCREPPRLHVISYIRRAPG